MSSQTALIQLHLVDYTPQGDIFTTDILPEILKLLDPADVTTKVLPVAETLDELMVDLPTEPGVWRIVFYDRAEQAVEKALRAEILPRKALAQWEQEIKALLGFQRKHRRSVLLADRAAVCRAPQVFANGLSTYLGINSPKTGEPHSTPDAIASVESVIAAQTVVQSLRARRLNEELDASSLPMLEGDGHRHCDVDAAFTLYVIEKSPVDDPRTRDLEAENDLLLMQMGNVQAELEGYFLEAKRLKETCIEYKEQLVIVREETTVVTLKVKGLSDQRHNTEVKLQDARDTLRNTEDKMQEREYNLEQAQQNVAQLEAQLHQREDELQQLLESTSWRVTGPLRKMKDRLVRSKDQDY